MSSNFEVIHVPERSRYELRQGERAVGFVDLSSQGDVVIIPYVQVDQEFEGQGLGARLVKGALDDLLAKGKRVVAHCGFAASVLRRHPRSADLMA